MLIVYKSSGFLIYIIILAQKKTEHELNVNKMLILDSLARFDNMSALHEICSVLF